jgi:hypothetical protein
MTEILDVLVQLAAFAALSAGTAGITWLSRRIAERLKLQSDAEVRAYLQQALERAVEYGQAEARRRLSPVTSEVTRERMPNMAAELARDYVQRGVPDALQRFAIDTARLDDLVRARMPKPATWPAAGS